MSQQPPFIPGQPGQPGQHQQPGQPGQGPHAGQAQQGVPPYPATTPPPPFSEPEAKKPWFARHKVLTIIGAVVLGIILLSAVFGGGGRSDDAAPAVSQDAPAAEQPVDGSAEEPGEAPAEEPAEEPADDAVGIGTPVASGDLEFTVTGVEPGGTEIGDVLTTTAQGEFLLVHIEVRNTGDSAETFSDSGQKLIDSQGREHETDSSASIYLPDNDVLFTSINPGNTVVGTLVFDLPADAEPVSVLLSGGLFSSDVEVSLR